MIEPASKKYSTYRISVSEGHDKVQFMYLFNRAWFNL